MDPAGAPRPSPLLLLKLVKKRWPPHHTASFASHQAPLGQISGSATESYIVPTVVDRNLVLFHNDSATATEPFNCDVIITEKSD